MQAILVLYESSSNEDVATVSNSGMVEATGIGSCTIACEATDGSGVFATCTLNVLLHGVVDLGLPSGTLWATCNIGADNDEDYGDYFAWGETTGYMDGKTDFRFSTYQHCKGSYKTMTKYCNNSSYGYNGFTDTLTELLPEDDAATANWGANWRMPSTEQFRELFNSSYTTTTWTTQNGVFGRLITSKMDGYTDCSLFLPAAGSRSGTSLNNTGSYGEYWSRTLVTSQPNSAYYLSFRSDYIGNNYADSNRFIGKSVRPVRASQ